MNALLFKCLVLCLSVSVVTHAQIFHLPNNTELNKLWHDFKRSFNKTYVGYHEERRRKAWEENIQRIVDHNKEAKNPEIVGDFYEMTHHLPEEFDWRKQGFSTPIYNQKDCGSCYAFSIALALQAQIFRQTKQLVPLSAQQLIDCSVSTGNYGCGGGSLRNTLRYLDQSGGLMTYKDYPYIAKQTRCQFERNRALVNLSSWAILPTRNERAMEVAINKVGPVAASINASPHTFQLYHSGVYDDPFCSPNTVNHAMLVVGYTKDAWILKNWWGNRWGEEGYMRLRKGNNRCGVANFVAYGIV
ncbi:hypothetical protein RI129_011832 [Pyrocoelia pectoralis]|uniref:Uncharacterized protein n=1 Tax=Pyrocoelia pectoralis TaxID=417401 RepID=A0AAN7UXF6_9COLE